MNISEDFKHHLVNLVIYLEVARIVCFMDEYCRRAPLSINLFELSDLTLYVHAATIPGDRLCKV